MARKKTGRPRGWRFDVELVRRRMEALVLTTARMALEAGRAGLCPHGRPITESGLNEALRVGRTSKDTLVILCRLLALKPSALITDPQFPRNEAVELERQLNRTRRISIEDDATALARPGTLQPRQDLKNVLRSAHTRDALLNGQPPSLREAVLDSVLFPALDDAHKDLPFVPGTDYNHFIQLALVVPVWFAGDEQPVVLGYHRSPTILPYTYVHTQGVSLLWTTGFLHGLGQMADLDMHEWIELTGTQSPAEAQAAFLDGSDPTILRLLEHRLCLAGHQRTIRPLGVVTNDQRGQGKARVYTHYVFRCDLKLPDTPADRMLVLADLIAGREQPVPLHWNDHRDQRFRSANGRPNLMDIVVWRGLTGDGSRHEEGRAQFGRRFAVA